MCQIFSLDAGETEALALMERNPQSIFLTDDASARLVAEQMRFNVHGTIGILIRSIRRRQRNPKEVLLTLSEIPLKSTLHIKPSLLNEISFNAAIQSAQKLHRNLLNSPIRGIIII